MLLIGFVVFKDPPTRRQMVSTVLSIAGVIVVISRGDISRLLNVEIVWGDLWMLLATVCWTFYSWLLARPSEDMKGDNRPSWNWAEFLFLQTMFAAFWATTAAILDIAVAPPPTLYLAPQTILAIIFVAIGPSLVAYRCWGLGVAAAGPTMAAFFFNLTPIFTALLQITLLNASPERYHGAAFLLIAGGIWVSTDRRSPPSNPPVKQ